MKKNDLIELEVVRYAFEGKGVAKIDKDNLQIKEEKGRQIYFDPSPASEENTENGKYTIFVHGAYPGDRVIARLSKIKKSYSEAKTLEVIVPSPEREEARCLHFGVCGGCKQQDLNYESQLKYKKAQVSEIFEKLGGLTGYEMEEIVASAKIFYYRNKMEFTFAEQRWLTPEEIGSQEEIDRYFSLGLHIPNMFEKVLDLERCFLQSPESNRIMSFTRDFFKSRNTSIYSIKNPTGYLRHLVIKQSRNTKDLMVNLVTFEEDDSLMKEYVFQLISTVPEVTTVINNINAKKALIATGDYEKIYFGSGYISDSIGNYIFRVSANSFFQTNTLQAVNLYKTALEFAGLTGSEIVYDLYSGAGTISLFVSDYAKHVYAFEAVESAVSDANENKKLNNASHVSFYQADLYKSFLPILEVNQIPGPDIVILDPPRNGMHENTVNDVISLGPKKLVYVSCNPATQVRDIKLFAERGGYRLERVRPVDMFPHTYHIENVALLIKD